MSDAEYTETKREIMKVIKPIFITRKSTPADILALLLQLALSVVQATNKGTEQESAKQLQVMLDYYAKPKPPEPPAKKEVPEGGGFGA